MLKKSRFLFAFLIFFPLNCFAANFLDVIINEVCWMGNENSPNDEWIELYNETDSDVDLNGWKLIAQDDKPEIFLSGTIPTRGFFILERTDDTTIPDISADIIYTGALNNQGEYLQLIDGQGNIIDEIDCTNGWPAGDNKTKQTMERMRNNWQASESPGGTPKAINSLGIPTSEVGEIAAIPQSPTLPQFSNDFITILLSGLPISLASSVSILALKRKMAYHKTKYAIKN